MRTPNSRNTIAIILFTCFFIISFVSYGTSNLMKKNELQSYYNMDNEEKLKETVSDLQLIGERRSWDGQHKASVYLQHRLMEMGLNHYRDVYYYNNKYWDNILTTFPGEKDNNSCIVIIAHYDSTSRKKDKLAPGADDNGTGVAVLLEIAQLLRKMSFNNDVHLVFFSNEEQGRQGSKAYAKKIRSEGTEVLGIINIDIVGYNSPMAFFSKDIFSILWMELSLKRKVKMILKMAYNVGTRLMEGSKTLKVVARTEDKHLIPEVVNPENEQLTKSIKWIIGNGCV